MFSKVFVEQLGSEIEIKLPDTKWFISDITKKWGSAKITNNIFTYQSYNRVRFQLFFAVDIYYIVDRLLFWIDNPKDPSNKNKSHIFTNKNVLRRIKRGLEENTWLKDIFSETIIEKPRLNLDHLNKLVFPPIEYQAEFFNYYNTQLDKYNLLGALLFASPGTGKTFMSLAVAECLEADYVVVISPNNALERVWGASLDITNKGCLFKSAQSFWISKSGLPYNQEKYIVVNYEYLSKLEPIIKNISKHKVMIILDESHNLNEVVSMRTQLFMDICKLSRSKDIIMMSGTPIKALGGETIPLFSAIDPYFTPSVMKRFKAVFGLSTNVATDILRNRLGLVTFMVEKKELNLDPPIYTDIKVSMPTGKEYTLASIKEKMTKYVAERAIYYTARHKEDCDQFFKCIELYRKTITSNPQKAALVNYLQQVELIRKAFHNGNLKSAVDEMKAANSFEKIIIAHLDKEHKVIFRDVKTIYKYVGLKIQGECLGNVLGKERARCNIDLCRQVDYASIINSAEKKTIIFTSFVDVLKECKTILEREKFDPVIVYGETNKELNALINKFDTDPTVNPLIATYQSLSTAVPLTMADNMILLNQPFRDYILTQAVSRIHRLNADSQIYVYNVLLDTGNEPNISTRSADILKWSQEQINLLLGLNIDDTEIDDSNGMVKIANESYDYRENFIMYKDIPKQYLQW
jgi:superfamily II DNA or RNA helicase